MKRRERALVAVALAAWVASSVGAAGADSYGLKPGPAQLKLAGPLAFGPPGILFVGDPQQAAIYAIRVSDGRGDAVGAKIEAPNLTNRLAKKYDASSEDIKIHDLAVDSQYGVAYVSLSAGDAAAIARIDAKGRVEPLDLAAIPHASTKLPNPPADEFVVRRGRRRNYRTESITDLQYVDGRLLVSGLSDEGASAVRGLNFPFAGDVTDASLEIFHTAHGRTETNAVVRTFVPFNIGGQPNLLAGFTCTPLVRFPLQSVSSGKQVRGATVAELGNRNRPIDMIVYEKEGQQFLLMANTVRGVMKISTSDIERPGLTDPVRDGGTAGQSFEKIESLKNVVQLDKLNDTQAVIITQEGSTVDLRTVELP